MKKKQTAVIIFIVAALAVIMSGCGEKEKDAATQQVLKITISPTPVITPEPEEVNPNAIVSKDNVTMTNLYLLEYPDAAPTPVPTTPSSSGESSGEEEDDVLMESVDDAEDYEDSDDGYDSYDYSYGEDDYS